MFKNYDDEIDQTIICANLSSIVHVKLPFVVSIVPTETSSTWVVSFLITLTHHTINKSSNKHACAHDRHY